MDDLWFVTPAYRRYELSAVCLEQRRRVITELALHGITAECVVISDDDNLDIARSLDFHVVERDNRWLGRKFNDGIQYALSRGAAWIVPIGSDDWIDPPYLWPLPFGPARTSHLYAPVEAERLALITIPTPAGAGPRVLHRNLFKVERPARERLRRGFDKSLMEGLGDFTWEYRDLHPLQYVGFRGELHITLYSKILRARGGVERPDPWALLASKYPSDLVAQARNAMSSVRPPRSIGRLDAWGIRDRFMQWFGGFWPGED
jgi:glycosyltransferase involved in cell wall biosynthesis